MKNMDVHTCRDWTARSEQGAEWMWDGACDTSNEVELRRHVEVAEARIAALIGETDWLRAGLKDLAAQLKPEQERGA